MKVHLYVLTMFLGVVLAVHLAMNGKVGSGQWKLMKGKSIKWFPLC